MKQFLYAKTTKIIAAVLFAAMLSGITGLIFYGIFQLNGENIVYHLEQSYNENNAELSNKLFRPARKIEAAIIETTDRYPEEEISFFSENAALFLDHTIRKNLSYINKNEVLYYAVVNGIAYTNCEDTDPASYQSAGYYIMTDESCSSAHTYRDESIYFTVPVTLYARLTPEYVTKIRSLWMEQRQLILSTIFICAALLILALILLIYLICVSGRSAVDSKIHLSAIDQWYTEADIILFMLFPILAAFAGIFGFTGLTEHGISYSLSLVFSTGGIFLAVLIAETAFFSMIRKLKANVFLKKSFAYRLFQFAVRILRRIFRVLSAFGKNLSSISDKKTGYIVGFFLGYRRYHLFEELQNALHALAHGNTSYQISDPGESVLGIMCQDVNRINDGMKASVEQAVKAERMKTELITNVSHDLKTPLTSIINYTKLLEEMELSPEEARDYVKIIAKKSDRLKQLTSDLFDISKVQSGNETIELEILDASELITQAMGESDQEIKDSGLSFCTRLSENLYISADGRKMSRVIGNLIGNILKYAQKGTRVFLSVYERDSKVLIELKNTSAAPLDFDENEITERFVRGDSSRSAEGNGLGLAIAKSYTLACGGDFQIRIDGDLFKVVLIFQKQSKNENISG